MVIFVDRMGVRVRAPTSPLEVLPADETPVGIDIRQRDGTDFLKVKVQFGTIYLRRRTENTCREAE